MTQYYFVGTALPPLSMESPPEITQTDFENLVHDNLSEKDYKKTRVVRNFYDIINLKSFWVGKELNPWGNLNENELEEAVASQKGLPFYVYDFLDTYEKMEDRIRHFPLLLSTFFRKAAKHYRKGFLHDYLTFEREWRLVVTAFRAKKLGRDLAAELQYEDPEEDFIAQILAQKDAKVYEPPEKYQHLKGIFEKYGDDPLELQKALLRYRFEYIESLVEQSDLFSFERVLAYMIQLIIVQEWFLI